MLCLIQVKPAWLLDEDDDIGESSSVQVKQEPEGDSGSHHEGNQNEADADHNDKNPLGESSHPEMEDDMNDITNGQDENPLEGSVTEEDPPENMFGDDDDEEEIVGEKAGDEDMGEPDLAEASHEQEDDIHHEEHEEVEQEYRPEEQLHEDEGNHADPFSTSGGKFFSVALLENDANFYGS